MNSTNSYRLLSTKQLSRRMGISVATLRALYRAGAPFLAKKSHPELLFGWMNRYPEKIPTKIE